VSRPRVLLVDDDASIRRFAELALDELDIELVCVAGVAEALAELHARGPAALVLTDLMMPGQSGHDLIRALEASPALRGGARLVVFSAGVGGSAAALEGHDIWRRLDKPASVAALEDCVRAAVAAGDAAPRPGRTVGASASLTDEELRAIEAHFGGERSLYVAFRDSCVLQFGKDAQAGEQALARGDLAGLRHLAHSLKSVLGTLGHDGQAATSRALELACAAGDVHEAGRLWPALHRGLLRLARRDGGD
jgi:CheY-like chemotaxis protein